VSCSAYGADAWSPGVISRWEQAGPDGLRPMLATAGTLPVRDTGWAYEMKWDGLRALAFISAGSVRLVSRTGRDITHAYPELAGLGGAVDASQAVLDGEIVAFGDSEWPDFEALQQRMNISSAVQARMLATQVPVSYLAFDVLWLEGKPLLDRPYSRRREVLDQLGLRAGRWQAPPSFTGESGAAIQAVSVEHDLEGIMAKRVQSRYEPGRRSQSWLKIKNRRGQHVVVGGWKLGEGARAGRIGSLLVGVHDDAGALVYAGHVGTGFTEQTLGMLGGRLAPLRRETSPFGTTVPREDARFAQWVEPELVADVVFGSWTKSGRLRAPSYKGLRDDIDPADVIREP
jgi:bifunctional non-homologous end joining protein LigD